MKMKSIIAVAILVPMIAGCTYTKTVPSKTFHLDANTFKCEKGEGKTHITIRDTIITDLLPAIQSQSKNGNETEGSGGDTSGSGGDASGSGGDTSGIAKLLGLAQQLSEGATEGTKAQLLLAIPQIVGSTARAENEAETAKITKAKQMLESCKGFLASEIKDT